MHSFWKQQLTVVLAASLIVASWPLPAAANVPVAPAAQLINVKAAGEAEAPTPADLPVSGQVIVKFRQHAAGLAGMSTASMTTASMTIARTVAGQGGAVLHQDGQSRMVVKLPKDPTAARALLASLRSRPDVAYVENNGIMRATADVPNDPGYDGLWGLRRMNVPAAWQAAPAPAGSVVVAVVDTGVDNTHPDLAGRVLPGYNAMTDDSNSFDDHYHGTHVSGTIAAAYNNGIGVAGVVGPANVSILPVKVLDASGSGNFFTVANGIDWAVAHGADVINLSLGGPHSDYVAEAIARAQSMGVVVVVAAGNDSTDTARTSPADVPGVVAVAALDEDDTPAWFSNHGDQVDLIAPGVNIRSTVPAASVTGPTGPEGAYGLLDGTSMASPHVAGLAALLKAARPELTRWAIQACLFASAESIRRSGYGYGVPQADKVLACDPAALDSQYALKLEGPDPDTPLLGAPAFSFDVKAGGERVTMTSSTGAELGATGYTGEGIVTVSPDLSGLPAGPTELTATLTDAAGAVIATQAVPVSIGYGPNDVGLALSTTQLVPTREKLKITTGLPGSMRYSMTVRNSEGSVVRTLVSNKYYTGPVFFDGKRSTGGWLPDGSYAITVITAAGVEAQAGFMLRVPPTPVAPSLTVADRTLNVPVAQIAGKVNPDFQVEAQVKAPGAAKFSSIGIVAAAEPDGRFVAPLTLTGGEGSYAIQIRGVDPADSFNVSSWTASAGVQLDATAPVIQLTSPTPVDGVVATNQNRLSLTGNIEAGAAVTALAENQAGAATSKTATADARGNWKLDLSLPSGADRLTLSAVDAAGNPADEQRYDVTMDTTAPALSPDSLTLTVGDTALTPIVTRGTYGFATALAPQYVLTGAVSERIGQVVPGSSKLSPTYNEHSFTVALSPALRNGTNTLTFDIYDVAGNKTRLTVAVVLDGTKPSVTVVQKDLALAPQPTPVTFTVNASEPLRELQVSSGNDRALDELTITKSASTDGRKWQVSVTFPTSDATWAFQFTGVDLAGNVGQPDARERRQVIIDGTSPELVLTNSTDSVIFTTVSSVTVTGTVADTGAGVASVTVGKTRVTPDKAGKFSARVSLAAGKLTVIPVVALDRAGNKRTETLQVVMKSGVGVLTVSTPRLSTEKQLTITGKTDAPIVLPDGPTVGVVPVTVVVTDSLKVARTYQAAVNPNGAYSVTADAADWPKGKYTVRVTAGVPDEFVGTAFKLKTATASFTIR